MVFSAVASPYNRTNKFSGVNRGRYLFLYLFRIILNIALIDGRRGFKLTAIDDNLYRFVRIMLRNGNSRIGHRCTVSVSLRRNLTLAAGDLQSLNVNLPARISMPVTGAVIVQPVR